MSKAIVVNSKGKGAKGVITEEVNVTRATTNELDSIIVGGVLEVANILSGGDVEDPTKKRCSRCVKQGRMPFHDIEQFSLLANGKRLSQCKVCRTEQSVEWERKRKEHRKEYHKEYQKTRKPAIRVPKALKEFAAAMAEQEGHINAREALFVALPTEDVSETQ
jgi:hypothetical protein